jgi:hypothetical protein
MKRNIGISGGQACGADTTDQACYELLGHLALLPDFSIADGNRRQIYGTDSKLSICLEPQTDVEDAGDIKPARNICKRFSSLGLPYKKVCATKRATPHTFPTLLYWEKITIGRKPLTTKALERQLRRGRLLLEEVRRAE